MKAKKAISLLAAAFCLLALFAVNADAALSWVTCTVDQAGPYGLVEGTSGSRVYLTDVSGAAWAGSKQCVLSPNRGKEYLAAALTALANSKQVRVYLNPALATPTINGFYVQK